MPRCSIPIKRAKSLQALQPEIIQAEYPDLDAVQEHQAKNQKNDAPPILMFRHRQLVTEKAQSLVMQGDAGNHGNNRDKDSNPVWQR